jgi:hypothetical protein
MKKTALEKRKELRKKLQKNPKLYNLGKKIFQNYQSSTHFLHALPDYLIIGAVKSGTTSMYSYLIQHPDIEPALTKQIHFFDQFYGRGIKWYKSNFPIKLSMNKKITGEATPFYFIHPDAPKRIHELIPNVKLIIMLRNPIDRAFSHYQMEYRHEKEKCSFEDALENENSRIEGQFEKLLNDSNYYNHDFFSRSYCHTGMYYNHLKRWMNIFPKEQCFIIDSDRFNEEPDLWYNKTLKFLNQKEFHLEEYKKMKKAKYSPVKDQTRKKLQEFFEPYNEKLYKLIDFNFNWK